MKINNTILLTLIIALPMLNSCQKETQQHLNGLSNYLEKLGYSFYNPPRTDRGPSSVFRFIKSESGKTTISPVCEKLFLDISFHESKLTIPSEHTDNNIKMDFAFSLINDLFSTPPKVGADANLIKTINVKFSDVSSHSINEEDIYDSEGERRSITPSCYSRLKDLSEEIKNKNVFIVQSSIRVNSMTYKIEKENTGGANLQVKLKKILSLKPEAKFIFKNDTTLEINEPRYIAFKAFLLIDYSISGLHGPASAKIKVEKLTPSMIKKRINN